MVPNELVVVCVHEPCPEQLVFSDGGLTDCAFGHFVAPGESAGERFFRNWTRVWTFWKRVFGERVSFSLSPAVKLATEE